MEYLQETTIQPLTAQVHAGSSKTMRVTVFPHYDLD